MRREGSYLSSNVLHHETPGTKGPAKRTIRATAPVVARHALDGTGMDPSMYARIWRLCEGDISRVIVHGAMTVEVCDRQPS